MPAKPMEKVVIIEEPKGPKYRPNIPAKKEPKKGTTIIFKYIKDVLI